MSGLHSSLQAAVGDAYRIERELGGGGMSRVFLADEVELGRRVVIKVLPPEMGAGVSIDRFKREIQLAARLQHPHVVPVLAAGSKDDLLYYAMPYIEGQSLRDRLAREGELPVGEAARILREVADALAYAHRNRVVHRDIKPDNVLLSEGHAVVTDFGVAKAVSSSTGESSLTSLGVALGTPAYMAPEQAVADPNVDHRADIYALGAMAYEMLTGEPPFTGPSPQAVLSMHVTEPVTPVTSRREAVSPELNAVVMRCLEKKAADRFQKAEELVPHLEALLTSSGGLTPTGTQPLPAVDYAAAARQAHPVRVTGLFALASVGVLAIVWALVQAFGLPTWVFVGAIGLLGMGLPIVLVTGHHERKRAMASATGIHPRTPVGLERHFRWKKTIFGGGVAFAGLGLVAAAFMASRFLGIGPAATLVSSGVLGEREVVILSDFVHQAGDSALATSITELFRVDIGQSPVVTLMPAGDVRSVLERMQREPQASLELAVAREIATREGVKAVIAGEINPIGSGAVISVRLVSPEDETDLIALRETAGNSDEIIPAINKLSRRLRERIGESLKTIRSAPSLEQVTTASLDALELYSRATRASEIEGDADRALSLLKEAVSIDTAFAMAWRKIAVIYGNSGVSPSLTVDAATKAFVHRDRLPQVERLNAEAFYYYSAVFDRVETIRVYRLILERDPDNITALNNLASQLNVLGQYAEAEALTRRGLQIRPIDVLYFNLIEALIGQGRIDEAKELVVRSLSDLPGNPSPEYQVAWIPGVERDYQAMDSLMREFLESKPRSLVWRWWGETARATSNEAMGKLAAAQAFRRRAMRISVERGIGGSAVIDATDLALIDLRYRQDRAAAIATVDAALAQHPLAEMEPTDRPYAHLIRFFAEAGETGRARALENEFNREVDAQLQRRDHVRHPARGRLALAEGDTTTAIQHFRAWLTDHDNCSNCGMFELATTFDAWGQGDSALSWYQRVADTPGLWNPLNEHYALASTYRRLGEIYELRGEREKAIHYYDEFVDLWKNADAELQPEVDQIAGRLARLVREGGR